VILSGWGGKRNPGGKLIAAYRRVCGFSHLQADCQGWGLAPESYACFKYGTTFTIRNMILVSEIYEFVALLPIFLMLIYFALFER